MSENSNATFLDNFGHDYGTIVKDSKWLIAMIILGPIFHLIVLFKYFKNRGSQSSDYSDDSFSDSEIEELRERIYQQQVNKDKYLGLNQTEEQIQKRTNEIVQNEVSDKSQSLRKKKKEYYIQLGSEFLSTKVGFFIALILNLPMFLLLLVLSSPVATYITNRLVAMIFVIIGVTVIVFTLLYMSPSDPAVNILGQQATQEQYANFRELHGLNQPYLVRLWDAIVSVFTFDFGMTFQGGVSVASDLISRFPVTLIITFFSLIFSLVVALPAGIYAGVKPDSTFDYIFMLIALIGISVPNFWIGLIFILNFSVQLGWLPATFSPTDWTSLIMPIVVLGVALMASVARMARSSTLEVINEDYVMTARSKGVSRLRVVLRHVVPNALIPVITIVGLQFSSMLAGASVTEKVFTVPGIGSYIVDKQFLPDIPAVLGGVVYIAVILSIVNLVVDLMYSFLDPRIRAKIQKGEIK